MCESTYMYLGSKTAITSHIITTKLKSLFEDQYNIFALLLNFIAYNLKNIYHKTLIDKCEIESIW